jgi:hypothetical protein
VHGWDLATATDQPFDLPEPTLRACWEYVSEFLPNLSAAVRASWGPAVPVPPDAPLLDRIVGMRCRRHAALGTAHERGVTIMDALVPGL